MGMSSGWGWDAGSGRQAGAGAEHVEVTPTECDMRSPGRCEKGGLMPESQAVLTFRRPEKGWSGRSGRSRVKQGRRTLQTQRAGELRRLGAEVGVGDGEEKGLRTQGQEPPVARVSACSLQPGTALGETSGAARTEHTCDRFVLCPVALCGETLRECQQRAAGWGGMPGPLPLCLWSVDSALLGQVIFGSSAESPPLA